MLSFSMARKRSRLDFKNEASKVRALLKSTREVWQKNRLQGIDLLLRTDQTYEQVADIIGCHESSVRSWAKSFRSGGLDQLLTRGNGGGRKSKLKGEALKEFTEKLRIGAFQTARQAQKWLEDEHGIIYGENSIYYMLGKLGGRLKVPRPCHEKKSVELE
jgi:transposase